MEIPLQVPRRRARDLEDSVVLFSHKVRLEWCFQEDRFPKKGRQGTWRKSRNQPTAAGFTGGKQSQHFEIYFKIKEKINKVK